ncbi:MAG: hypothetical protein JJT96_05565 [Opitutales bacterium]|nr:hypothetical protein [Opitutales bacterium]
MLADSGKTFERWNESGHLPGGGRLWLPVSSDGSARPQKQGGPPPEILYLNDLHGHFERIAPAWFEARASLEGSGKPFLCLSGGDEHGGASPWDVAHPMGAAPDLPFAWQAVLGIHAAVPGNHDLDWGWEAYGGMIRAQPSIPRVLSHLRAESPVARLHSPVILLEWPDHLMALLGALNVADTTEGSANLLPPGPALAKLIAAFAPVVDSLVILSHLGWEQRAGSFYDPSLLPGLPPHALLLGAHSHTRLPSHEQWSNESYLQCAPNAASFGRASWKDGRWSVRNVSIPRESSAYPGHAGGQGLPSLPEIVERRQTTLRKNGVLPIPGHDFSVEAPAVDGYCGECAHFNAVSDTLAEFTATHRPHLAALCVRTMTPEPLCGKLTAADWYRRFGYADRCFILNIPENALWPLLRENARRLLMPARFISNRGFLHFSSGLRYAVSFDSEEEPSIHSLVLAGESLAEGTSPALSLTTNAYVATGQGGFAKIFRQCGIPFPGIPHPTHNKPVRDLLWHAFREAEPATLLSRFRKDGRLQRFETSPAVSG